MLRAALIVVIIAGLAVVGLNFTKVSERIKNLTAERDQAQQAQKTAQENETKAKAAQKKAVAEADKLKSDLASTTQNLQTASAKAAEQEKRANRLDEQLQASDRDRIEAQRQVAQWSALGINIDQVRALQGRLEQATKERDAFTAENKILLRRNSVLEARVRAIEGPDLEVKLPALKGKIVAVDPKYDFVVLNVGSNQGLLQGGKLIVERDGKLLAKVRVTSVEPNRSIANVMPDWKQGDVMEGDEVLTSYEALAQP